MSNANTPDENAKSSAPGELSGIDSDPDNDASSYGFGKVAFKNHEIIFDEGDVGDAAYLIISGSVEIRKGVLSDHPHSLAMLKNGEAFGEMALFDDSVRMAQAMARSDVIAIRISRDEFARRLESVDPIMRTTIFYMVKRVRDMASEFMLRKGSDWNDWRKDRKPDAFQNSKAKE